MDPFLDPSVFGVDPDLGIPQNWVRPFWEIAGYEDEVAAANFGTTGIVRRGHSIYPMLRNSASGPELGFSGQISAGS